MHEKIHGVLSESNPGLNLVFGQEFKFIAHLDTARHIVKHPLPWGRGPHYYIPGTIEVNIDNLSLGDKGDATGYDNAFANLVNKALERFRKGHPTRKIIVQVFIGVVNNGNRLLYDNSEWKCKIHVHEKLVQELPNGCKIKVNLNSIKGSSINGPNTSPTDLGSSMSQDFGELEFTSEKPSAFLHESEEANFESYKWCQGELGVPQRVTYNWMSCKFPDAQQDCIFQGKVQVLLEAPSKSLESSMELSLSSDLLSMNKLMLESKVHSDLTILCGSGENVLAHKAVLAACSPVLRNMLDSRKWKQPDSDTEATNTLSLKEMTKEGVEALLAYMYCWELHSATKCLDIAVQLLIAGNKFLMEMLQEKMINLLLIKPVEWFDDLDALIEVYLFTERTKICATLENKIAGILKDEGFCIEKCPF